MGAGWVTGWNFYGHRNKNKKGVCTFQLENSFEGSFIELIKSFCISFQLKFNRCQYDASKLPIYF